MLAKHFMSALVMLFASSITPINAMQYRAPPTIKPPPPSVLVENVRQERWQPVLRSVGTLTPTQGVGVTTETAGIVKEILFNSGDKVEAGKVLVRLDDRVDQAALASKKAVARLAEVQLQRSAELLPKKMVAKSTYDEAKATYDAAQADVAQYLAIINRKVIEAPFAGFLGLREVNLGQYLKPGDRVASLQALDPIFLDYSLPERHYAQLQKNQVIKAHLDAFPGKSFTGRIESIEPGIDVTTRMVKIRAVLANSEGLLRPGGFAEVLTNIGSEKNVLIVPRTAISFNTYGDFIFVVEQDDKEKTIKAIRRQVTIGEVRGGWVEVTKGLKLNERIVSAGVLKLKHGVSVRIDTSVKLNHSVIQTQ